MLFSPKNEGNPVAYNNVDEHMNLEDIILSKI
jgi:hypothetical protein